LRIKAYYGASESAVKPKLGMALSVYVLVAIIKKQLGLDLGLHKILQILERHSFRENPNSRGVSQLQRRDHRYRALHPVESIRLLMGQH